MNYLTQTSVPFVVIGSTPDTAVMQVDVAHAKACQELTARLIQTTQKPIGIILGSMHYIVNLNRRKGCETAAEKAGADLSGKVISDIFTKENIDDAVDKLLLQGVGTILCGDDQICLTALNRLDKRALSVGKDIRVASLYDNPALCNRSITAIGVDDMTLGALAVKKLVGRLESKNISEQPPAYLIHYRASTGDIGGKR